MWIKTEGNPTNFDRRNAEHLHENCQGIWTRNFGPVEWPARSPDLHMSGFFPCSYIKWIVVTSSKYDTDDEVHKRQNTPHQVGIFNVHTSGYMDAAARLIFREKNGVALEA
jgi:hypothetical protein